MARTTYTVDALAGANVNSGGTTVNKRTGDNTNGHYIANSGKTKVLFVNTAASGATATLYPGGHPSGDNTNSAVNTVGNLKVDSASVQVKTVNFAANESRLCGPFPTAVYGSQLVFDVSASTVTFYAFEDNVQ